VYGPEVITVYHYYWENRLVEFRNMDADTDFTLENLPADRLILGFFAQPLEMVYSRSCTIPSDSFLSSYAIGEK